jgi:nicotinate-nucleotide pyrophosphorylase (carboxylating)
MQRLELERFVFEDVGEWDDSSTLVPEVEARASVVAREDCVISGLQEAEEILTYFCLEADLYDEASSCPQGQLSCRFAEAPGKYYRPRGSS